MAQPFLDHMRVSSGPDQASSLALTKIMEPNARMTSFPRQLFKVAPLLTLRPLRKP